MSPRHRAGDHRRAAAADDRRQFRRVMRCPEGRRQVEATRPADTGQGAGSPGDSNASARVSSGRTPTSRSASIVLLTPGGPVREQVVPADAASSTTSRASFWPTTSARSPPGDRVCRCRGVPTRPAGCLLRALTAYARRVRPGGGGMNGHPFDKASLGDTRGRHDDMAHTRGCGLPSPRKGPQEPAGIEPSRPNSPNAPIAPPRTPRDHVGGREHGDRDGQVTARPVLGMGGGREVDDDPAGGMDRPALATADRSRSGAWALGLVRQAGDHQGGEGRSRCGPQHRPGRPDAAGRATASVRLNLARGH